jgi:hypothetical protein
MYVPPIIKERQPNRSRQRKEEMAVVQSSAKAIPDVRDVAVATLPCHVLCMVGEVMWRR